MRQIHYPASHAIYRFEGLLRFCGAFRLFGLAVRPQPNKEAETPSEEHLSPTPRYDCGGYNEAFMAQHWANYDPIR